MSSPGGPESGGICCERAVSSIDSVEGFDESIAIVSSRAGLALAVIGALRFSLAMSAIFGTVAATVQGRGVTTAGSGIEPVIAPSGGTLIALSASAGDSRRVRHGDRADAHDRRRDYRARADRGTSRRIIASTRQFREIW